MKKNLLWLLCSVPVVESSACASTTLSSSGHSHDFITKQMRSRRTSLGVPPEEDFLPLVIAVPVQTKVDPYHWRYFSCSSEEFNCYLDTTCKDELFVHFRELLEYNIEQQPAFKNIRSEFLKKKLRSFLKVLTVHLKSIAWGLTHFREFKEALRDKQLPFVAHEFMLFKKAVEEECATISKKYRDDYLHTSPASSKSCTGTDPFLAVLYTIPVRRKNEEAILQRNTDELDHTGADDDSEWEDTISVKSGDDEEKGAHADTNDQIAADISKASSSIQASAKASRSLVGDSGTRRPIQSETFKTITQLLEKKISGGDSRAQNHTLGNAGPKSSEKLARQSESASPDLETTSPNKGIPTASVHTFDRAEKMSNENRIEHPEQGERAPAGKKVDTGTSKKVPPPLPPRRYMSSLGASHKAVSASDPKAKATHQIDAAAVAKNVGPLDRQDRNSEAGLGGDPFQPSQPHAQEEEKSSHTLKKKKNFFWVVKPLIALVGVATVMYLYMRYSSKKETSRGSSQRHAL